MSARGQTPPFGDVGSMSGLPESGHGWAIYEYTPQPQPPGEKVYNDQEDDGGDENMDVSPHIRTEHCHCLLLAFQRHRSLPQSSSASRLTADASGFFILSQSGERPERWEYICVTVRDPSEGDPGAIEEPQYAVAGDEVLIADLDGRTMGVRRLGPDDDPATIARRLLRDRAPKRSAKLVFPDIGIA
jgi:hypothetical protein